MASCCLRVSAFAVSSGSRQGVDVFFAAEEEADPVALVADGEEATVVFEGAGVFDAVLVELPQEIRSRGRIASAAPRRRPLERSERRTGVWVMRPPHKKDGTIYCVSVYVGRCSVWGVLQIPTRNGKNFSKLSRYSIVISGLSLVSCI